MARCTAEASPEKVPGRPRGPRLYGLAAKCKSLTRPVPPKHAWSSRRATPTRRELAGAVATSTSLPPARFRAKATSSASKLAASTACRCSSWAPSTLETARARARSQTRSTCAGAFFFPKTSWTRAALLLLLRFGSRRVLPLADVPHHRHGQAHGLPLSGSLPPWTLYMLREVPLLTKPLLHCAQPHLYRCTLRAASSSLAAAVPQSRSSAPCRRRRRAPRPRVPAQLL